MLPRDVPEAGRCAQTHHIPWVQVRPDTFPMGPFPHLLQNLYTSDAESHCCEAKCQPDSPNTPVPSPAPPKGQRGALPTIPDGFLSCQKKIICELCHFIHNPCPRPLSLPNGLWPFDFHSASWLLQPGFMVNTALPILFPFTPLQTAWQKSVQEKRKKSSC